MKELGFDHIIDYKQEDFTKNGQRYDLILDTKTNRSTFRYLSSLTPHGRYVTVGGYIMRLLQTALLKPLISIFSKKKVHIVALQPNKDLDYINELFETGKMTHHAEIFLEERADARQPPVHDPSHKLQSRKIKEENSLEMF